METSGIVFLVISALASFAAGRAVMHFWKKKQRAKDEQIQKNAAQVQADLPPEPESRNKAKRRRQQQQLARKSSTRR